MIIWAMTATKSFEKIPILKTSDSIADSDASAASNGGKKELMHYVH